MRAIVPSSFIISMSAAAGYRPERRARSMLASVCPARRNTPLSCAYKGFMCPGRANVSGLLSGDANAFIVAARSAVDTPVEHPSTLSMVTVKGVPKRLVFALTCGVRSSSLQRDIVIGAHNTPRPFFNIKFTASGVIFSAAIIKSPSFSLSSSSTTIRNLPSLKSSRASSMVFNLKLFIYLSL